MNPRKTKLKKLGKTLNSQLKSLLDSFEHGSGDITDVSRSVMTDDVSDGAQNDSCNNTQWYHLEAVSNKIKDLELAIQKLKDGTYGDCEECEKQIPLARLEAMPFATMCLKCQEEMEKL